jgi:hypothetical protein
VNLEDISAASLHRLSDTRFKEIISTFIRLQSEDLKENAILYYRPVSSVAERVHLTDAGTIGIGGGNRSSKTETCLAEIVMCATGITPLSLTDKIDTRKKFLGPINVRIVVESITTVLHSIMLPKLQYWKWSGLSPQGGSKGHWGWIPKTSLVDGAWDKSWSEKNRLLRVLYRDPEDFDRVMGESTIQFMSHDQDPSDFSSGDFNIILHDEPPKYATWRENQARLMGVAGRNMLAMTWPDDPSIAVDWIFDEVYEKAKTEGNTGVEWIELVTTDNQNVDQGAIAKQAASWSAKTRKTRIYGQPIRFSNRIHPDFTDYPQVWCFKCKDAITPRDGACAVCGSTDTVTYNHVSEFDPSQMWPTVFLLDPHPRKPHMFMWVQVDSFDDLWVVAYDKVEDVPTAVKKRVDQIESEMKLRVYQRLIDPNMGASPAGVRREVTWADEFREAGLFCDLADDSDVGRARLNDYLKPDQRRLAPRVHFRAGLFDPILQMKRYSWDEYRNSLEKDLKQRPKEKYDDYPTMLKYLMNTSPSFNLLVRGAPVLHRKRRGAYG